MNVTPDQLFIMQIRRQDKLNEMRKTEDMVFARAYLAGQINLLKDLRKLAQKDNS